MKLLIFLQIPAWANLSENGPPESDLDFLGSPRFNETCDSLENAEMCEAHCQDLYHECMEYCSDHGDDQDIG